MVTSSQENEAIVNDSRHYGSMHVARLRKIRKTLGHNSWYFGSCSDRYPAEDEARTTIIHPEVR